LDTTRAEIRDLEAEDEILDHVAALFRTLIDAEVTDNAKAVERLLTEGLQAVFEDMDLSVKAAINVQRGKVAVDLITIQKQADGSLTEGDSTDVYGGSVATIESVLLRVIVVLRRGMRPLLLLDESLGAVAEHYVPNVGRFLSLLCRRLDMDVLAVTHNPTLVEAADRSYRIKKADGRATFREVR
jgi:ABC-type iron transport system FetAB ATPase subunit